MAGSLLFASTLGRGQLILWCQVPRRIWLEEMWSVVSLPILIPCFFFKKELRFNVVTYCMNPMILIPAGRTWNFSVSWWSVKSLSSFWLISIWAGCQRPTGWSIDFLLFFVQVRQGQVIPILTPEDGFESWHLFTRYEPSALEAFRGQKKSKTMITHHCTYPPGN